MGCSTRPAHYLEAVAKYGDARRAGRDVVDSMRVSVAEKVADLIRRDPDRAAQAVEMGLVDRRWLDEPGRHKLWTATPVDVVHRYLERSVEQRPSALRALGLNALQVLSWWATEAPQSGGTHTHLAVVFTDLEGFTRYTDDNGDEAASQLLADHQRAVGPVLRSRGGRLVKRLGDGLLVTFPEPEAAVLAAIELAGTAPEPLRLRAGVHCGEVYVTHDDVMGQVVNLAARVTDLAKGGEVLVTEAVRAAVRELPGASFGRARRRSFKGVKERVTVCPVSAA
jgi:adenylate cyclase